MGIEPTYPAWKAGVLPLNYTRTKYCVSFEKIGVTGFEPATPWSQTRCSSQTEPHPALRYQVFSKRKCYYIESTRVCQSIFFESRNLFRKGTLTPLPAGIP